METRIKEFRARDGLTQEQVAHKVGVSRQTILYIERGQYNPSLLLAMKISKALKCKIEELFKPNEQELKEGEIK
jgi:putative transcriptional regulator